MTIESFIARRYLTTSIINVIATVVVAIGSLLMVVVFSVMNGFEKEVKDRIVGHGGHVFVRKYQNELIADYDSIASALLQLDHVVGVSPVISEKVGLDSREVQEGAMCIGLDPAYAEKTTRIREYIKWGDLYLDSMESDKGKVLPGIVLGTGLANRLRVSVGDELFLLSFQAQDDIYSSITPRVKRFAVCALYESGYNEYDANFAMVGLKQAQDLFMLGDHVNNFQIKIDDGYRAPEMAEVVKEALGENAYQYYVTHWIAVNSMLFKWIKLEKLIMFLILSAYIFLAALSIVSSLITVVIEKTREIGILKSMGASNSTMIRIFLYQGLLIGVIGTLIGVIPGVALCLFQEYTHMIPIPGDIYFMDYMPSIVRALDVVVIVISIVLLCCVATIFPAYKAGRLMIVEALRYE